ncbi:MAG: ABC transporter ATP-binding protein [Rhizobiaceae bacterium]
MLLDVRDLTVVFDTPAGVVRVVNSVSYALREGETLGIVGESGSGKSVHALALLRLLRSPPGRIASGQVLFRGQDLLAMRHADLLKVRGGQVGFIFQDPMTSLNPVLTIGRQITEIIEAHSAIGHRAASQRAVELLDMVKIPNAAARLKQYPHEFSGGMRQRVMIATALACRPKLLIADEPTTALDVTVQSEIIQLVKDLQKSMGMAVIWITHDLGVVAGIVDTVQVMYAGRIVERGPVMDVFSDPRHAYTLGLLRCASYGGSDDAGRLTPIEGTPPRMTSEQAPGDPFAPRNPYATERCWREMPPLVAARDASPEHLVAAWYDLRNVTRSRKAPS